MFRISLRELLILIAIAAVCLVSLKHASHTWLSLVVSMSILMVFAAVIVAVAECGPRQKFALTFAILSAGYYFVVVTTPGAEASGMTPGVSREPDGGAVLLPTSHLLHFVWSRTQVMEWVDPFTGKTLGKVAPGQPPPPVSAGPGFAPNLISHPPYEKFMRIGHFWWALLFGYLGGRFARSVYIRRAHEREN